MHSTARAVMAKNGGLITRPEASDAGLSPGAIRMLVRTGELVLVRRGVYVDGEVWSAADDYRGKHRIRTRAAIRMMQRGFVISHDSAAYELGLEILAPPVPHVHITRPGFTPAWTRYGVKHHLARFTREQVVRVDELEVLDMARTAVDIAREHGEPYGEIACDAALRHGVHRAALNAAMAPMVNWPFMRRTRRAIDFADVGAQNAAETLGRLLVHQLGVGEIETQFPIRLESGKVAWCDLRVGCHVFEVDGRIKYQAVADGGTATTSAEQVIWEEKKREREIRRRGLGVSRIIWPDYWLPQRTNALKRLREEYADTATRFGTQLPERLAAEALALRASRGA